MSLSYLQTSLDKLNAASRDDVIEICVNPDGTCWGEFQGDHFMRLLEQSLSETEVKDLGNQIASSANTTMSKDRPIVSVSINYRDRPIRAQVITPPLEKTRQLRTVVGSGNIEDALAFCVENKLNMIVSGGTSTGKTVAARKILSHVSPDERIVTIEEASELVPSQPNAVTLIANRDAEFQTADVLLTATLRMRPDRIILGEVRGKEAMTFLEAINTGHGGSMTTLHAETPQLAVQRLAIAALKTEIPMTYADMVRYIEKSIDVIIQAGRHDGKRGVTEFYLPGSEQIGAT